MHSKTLPSLDDRCTYNLAGANPRGSGKMASTVLVDESIGMRFVSSAVVRIGLDAGREKVQDLG